MHVQIPVIMAALLLGSTASAQNSSSQASGTVKHQPEATVKEQVKQTKAPLKEEKLILADPTAGNKKEMTMAEYDAYRKKQVQEAAKKKQPAKQKPQVQFAPPVVKKDQQVEKPKLVKQDEKPMVKFAPPKIVKDTMPKVKFKPPVIVKDTIIPRPVKVQQIAPDTFPSQKLKTSSKLPSEIPANDVKEAKRYLVSEVSIVTMPDGSRKLYDKDGKDITAEIPDLPTAPFPEQ